MNESFFFNNNIPYRKSGGFIVAWNENDLDKPPELVAKAHKAGVTDVRQVTANERLEKEPPLSHKAFGAIYVLGESLVDPWKVPITLANIAMTHNATILTSCHVTDGKRQKNHWQLSTSKGPITASVVINCAGLFGDELETIHRQSPFTIKPRKGQYAVFSKSAGRLLNSVVIFPVPTPKTKGVLVFPTVYGNIYCGWTNCRGPIRS